jgi:hypothetical protein
MATGWRLRVSAGLDPLLQGFVQFGEAGLDRATIAAALAVAGPPRSADDIFESCITRLIDVAGLDS